MIKPQILRVAIAEFEEERDALDQILAGLYHHAKTRGIDVQARRPASTQPNIARAVPQLAEEEQSVPVTVTLKPGAIPRTPTEPGKVVVENGKIGPLPQDPPSPKLTAAGKVPDGVGPRDALALEVGRALPDQFCPADLAERLEGLNTTGRAYQWIACWKSKGWIETKSFGKYARVEAFGV